MLVDVCYERTVPVLLLYRRARIMLTQNRSVYVSMLDVGCVASWQQFSHSASPQVSWRRNSRPRWPAVWRGRRQGTGASCIHSFILLLLVYIYYNAVENNY